MLKAKDIMTRKLVTFSEETPVTEAAKVLAAKKIGGAPVVDSSGAVVGVVSESDLIIQDVKLHFPHFINLLDSYIFLGSLKRFETLLKKAVAAKVKDLMTTEVISVTPEATIEDVATLLTEKQISRVLVMSEGRLLGIITKGDIVKSLAG